ncbi:YkvA family protein [Halomonas sp. NCCP-2165]|nr:YkvA family protein [Halomonas sp. NCCP-2165]GKW48600.1 hypothetical protein NCCP2165_08150 [Halomonas sp. NCCP-2165]
MNEKEVLDYKGQAAIDEAGFLKSRDEGELPHSAEEASSDAAGQYDAGGINDGSQPYHDQETKEDVSEETAEEIKNHEKNYSDDGFWNKATKYAKKAGEKTLSPALKLYYSAKDPDTPTWAKTTMYGALGYFISPVDGIPDITPVLGYTDDVGVLAGAIGIVAAHIKDEHAEQAMQTLKRWFS